jgi:GDPmannose 4,6-dehydratase
LVRIISKVMPDEIYNLGAMSHVRVSFDMPSFTIQTNALGVLNMLEVYRTICPASKILSSIFIRDVWKLC